MSWEDALMNGSILYAVTNIVILLVCRWVSWEDALMNGSILYAVTDIVALVLNRRMAASTVVHHYCTAAALFVVLASDLRQDGLFKGGWKEDAKCNSPKTLF